MSDYSIGVDLGGTNLRIATLDRKGRIRDQITVPAEVSQGPDHVIDRICETVSRSLDPLKREGQKPLGIGVGVPGIIYFEQGLVHDSPNLPGWTDIPLRDRLQERLQFPVYLENDANSAALGEKWMGRGRDTNDLCLLTLGTGVGGGIVLNGRIWHGFQGMAGEVGHINIYPDGLRCGCNNRGCLEQYASATAVIREAEKAARQGLSPLLRSDLEASRSITAKVVAQRAHQGDKVAGSIYAEAGKALGIGLGSLINILNLPLCLLGGGMASAWDLFAPALFEEVRTRSYIFRTGETRIEPAELDEDAGLYGNAYLSFQNDDS